MYTANFPLLMMVEIMQRRIRIYFGLILLILSGSLFAQPVTHLSRASIPVTKRSPEAVAQAAPQALAQVLIKMSGNPSVTQLPEIQQVLQGADQLVQSFGYVSQTHNGKTQLLANIQFDPAALKQLLHQVHQAVWRADRPITLAWVNVDRTNNNPNPILASDEQSSQVLSLKEDSDRLGLPIILPTMDIQDQSYINTDANFPFDTEKLLAAGKRYQSHSVLAGKISAAVDGSWQGQWMYLLNGEPHQWNTVGQTSEEVIAQAMNDMDSIMSSTLAVRDNSKLQTSVNLQVAGVINLSDYALVIHRLKQLNVVAHVGVSQLDGSTMKLQLDVVGGKQALAAALQDDADLKPQAQPFVQAHMAENSLFYEFKTQDGNVS